MKLEIYPESDDFGIVLESLGSTTFHIDISDKDNQITLMLDVHEAKALSDQIQQAMKDHHFTQ